MALQARRAPVVRRRAEVLIFREMVSLMNWKVLRLVSMLLCGQALCLPDAAATTVGGTVPFGQLAGVSRGLPAAPAVEQARWQEIRAARRPNRIVALCEAFSNEFPGSALREDVRRLGSGAARALSVQYDVGLSGDLFEAGANDPLQASWIAEAARGNAAAAFELAQVLGRGGVGETSGARQQERWLRFAAKLGHARANWELAELYNVHGRIAEAAHFEKRAVELGYRLPPRLSTRGY